MLRRGGRLLVTVPFHGARCRPPRSRSLRFDAHFDPLGQHLRFFTARSLARTLDAAGFAPVDIAAAGGVPGLRRMLVARAGRP